MKSSCSHPSPRWFCRATLFFMAALPVAYAGCQPTALPTAPGPVADRVDVPPAPAEQTFDRSKSVPFALPEQPDDELPFSPMDSTTLQFGEPQRATMNLRDYAPRAFKLDVPEDTVAVLFEVRGAPCTLDLLARLGEPVDDVSPPDYYNYGEENRLMVSRMSEVPLESGELYLSVEYPLDSPPVFAARPLELFDYEIEATVISTRVDGQLKAGEPMRGTLTKATGGFRSYTINVPADVDAVRFDLDQVEGDLNLWAKFDAPMISSLDADILVASLAGRETLILDAKSDPPLRPGRWYLNVSELDAWDDTPFVLHTSFGHDPPAELLAIPKMGDEADSPLRTAVHATVELSSGNYAGTGVLVSPNGLLLSNHHVVLDAVEADKLLYGDAWAMQSDAGPSATDSTNSATVERDQAESNNRLDLVVVAATIDPRQPPVELFRARVLDTREQDDLALLQITSGFYGQPLPDDYRFPYVPFAEAPAPRIGDAMTVVGFPSVGGLSSRPPVTITRGILSGFSTPTIYKTDAAIMGGNSGGAALDDGGKLIGLPAMVVEEGDSRPGFLGFVISTQAIPDEWSDKIREAIAAE
ncbi:MAG: trypsin-like peptidase domain-containing protein [Pirellulaceae bacterium]